MKYLDIDEETEKEIIRIMDAALKYGGIEYRHVVHSLESKVKLKEDPTPKVVEAKVEKEGQ